MLIRRKIAFNPSLLLPMLYPMDVSPWFLVASLSGLACASLSLAVIVAGWTRRVAEVAILGSGLFSLSIFAAAFGLSVTGLGGGSPASPMLAFLALPTAVVTAFPLLGPTRVAARFLAQRWRAWVLFCAATNIIGIVLLIGKTDPVGTVSKTALLTIGILGSLKLANRQVYLYRISGRNAALATAVAIASLTLSTSLGPAVQPGSTWSWVVLVAENAAVLSAGGAVIYGYRTGQNVADILGPMLSNEPLAALELGLSPEVHSFVAALEQKDQVTRDHVVRTSALAMRVAIRAELNPGEVREIALGALLHDIGKLVVPSDIINKPGRLTDEEFATIQTHPEQGERLLEGSVVLAPAARYVRGHHERVDGKGYPDGLEGDQLSLEVAIVSVCDAWDAMTHTRQYRDGMGTARATEILQKGAGSQWRADAVLLLLAEVKSNGQSDLDAAGPIGRHDLVDMQCQLTEQTLAEEILAEEMLNCCAPESAPQETALQETVRTRSIARPSVSNRSDKVSPAG